MKQELEYALNTTAPMSDNNGQTIKAGSFMYEDKVHSFIMQNQKLTVRCTELLIGQADDFNNYPNLNVDFHRISDKMDSEELCNFLDTDLFDSYVVSL